MKPSEAVDREVSGPCVSLLGYGYPFHAHRTVMRARLLFMRTRGTVKHCFCLRVFCTVHFLLASMIFIALMTFLSPTPQTTRASLPSCTVMWSCPPRERQWSQAPVSSCTEKPWRCSSQSSELQYSIATWSCVSCVHVCEHLSTCANTCITSMNRTTAIMISVPKHATAVHELWHKMVQSHDWQ